MVGDNSLAANDGRSLAASPPAPRPHILGRSLYARGDKPRAEVSCVTRKTTSDQRQAVFQQSASPWPVSARLRRHFASKSDDRRRVPALRPAGRKSTSSSWRELHTPACTDERPALRSPRACDRRERAAGLDATGLPCAGEASLDAGRTWSLQDSPCSASFSPKHRSLSAPRSEATPCMWARTYGTLLARIMIECMHGANIYRRTHK